MATNTINITTVGMLEVGAAVTADAPTTGVSAKAEKLSVVSKTPINFFIMFIPFIVFCEISPLKSCDARAVQSMRP